jgi:plasmid maintenance system antidote protein VapI
MNDDRMIHVRRGGSDHAVQPGYAILKEFAYKLGLNALELLHFFNGTYRIDEKLAAALHKEIGPSPQFWLNLQAKKRLADEPSDG